jgi:pimeloyl-ACP methyl ester carboxylesterase
MAGVGLIVLLPSPLLGSAVWDAVAEVFAELGRPALAVDISGPAPHRATEALQAFLRELPTDEDLILVPHSNAGSYAGAIAAHRRVSGVVFVDAGLPRPAGDEEPALPPQFYDFLAAKADDDGLLPPWTQWWDEEELTPLFPDSAIRRRIEEQQRRLPLSYFQDPVPSGMPLGRCAYLAFGESYRSEADRARQRGWPVKVLEGEHLEMVVHPRLVAAAILELLSLEVQ